MTAVTVKSLWGRGRASTRRMDVPPGDRLGPGHRAFCRLRLAAARRAVGLQLTDLCSATVFLVALGLGEGLVILTRGIDLSIGGVLSMGTAIAATHFVSPGSEVAWSAVIILSGAAVGVANGALIGILRLQPFIVTLATWSIVSGIALLVLPIQGGSIPTGFANWINLSSFGLPNAAWVIIAMVVLWSWFKRTRLCRRIYALGSDPEGAAIAGVQTRSTLIAVYCIAGVCAAVGSILYAMLTASGDPTVGNGEILPAVTVVVIGGTSLYGGSGGFVGTIGGAFALTLIADVVFAWNLSSYWQELADGVVLIVAVLLGGTLRSLRLRPHAGSEGAVKLAVPRRHRSIALAYVLLLLLVVVGRLVASGFLGIDHIDELIDEGALIGFVALGQGFVILAGGVDLSIPWVVTSAGILVTTFTGTQSSNMIWDVPLIIGLAAIVGLINGLGVVVLGVTPIIMTLGMSTVIEGVLLLYTNGSAGGNVPGPAVYLATHKWGEIPVMAVAWLVLIVAVTFTLSLTPFGRRLYAVGLNRRVALFSGVDVKLVTCSVYVISSSRRRSPASRWPATWASPTSGWVIPTCSPPSPPSPSAARPYSGARATT